MGGDAGIVTVGEKRRRVVAGRDGREKLATAQERAAAREAVKFLRQVVAANRADDAQQGAAGMTGLLGVLGPMFFGADEGAVAELRHQLEQADEALGDMYAEAMDILAGFPTAGREPVYTLSLLVSTYGLRVDHAVVRLERMGALESALAAHLGVASDRVSVLPLLIDPDRDELYLTHFHRCAASVKLQLAAIPAPADARPVRLQQQKVDGQMAVLLVSIRPAPRRDGGLVTVDSLSDAIMPWIEANGHLYPVPYFIEQERFTFFVRPVAAGGPFTGPRMSSYSLEREQLQSQIEQAKRKLGGSLAGVRGYIEAVYDPTIHEAPSVDGLRVSLWAEPLETLVGACAFDLVAFAPMLLNRLLSVLAAHGLTAVTVIAEPVALANCPDCGEPLFVVPEGRAHETGSERHTLH